jgi:uncharacterized protein with NRDE domain
MCLIAFAWKARPDFPLIVAANRDEWHERPAAAAAWWPAYPDVLAGRDLEAGGTWLGVTRDGRFAALTNFRDPSERKSTAPTRGRLVLDYLSNPQKPLDFIDRLSPHAARYNGFNLLLSDGESMYWYGSRENEALEIAPGIHALSNHRLDEPWPKVENAKSSMGAASGAFPAGTPHLEPFFTLLSNDAQAPDHALPDTGVGLEWERVLSPALIVSDRYGTRCSTVFTMSTDRQICFEERTRDQAGRVSHTAAFAFQATQR